MLDVFAQKTHGEGRQVVLARWQDMCATSPAVCPADSSTGELQEPLSSSHLFIYCYLSTIIAIRGSSSSSLCLSSYENACIWAANEFWDSAASIAHDGASSLRRIGGKTEKQDGMNATERSSDLSTSAEALASLLECYMACCLWALHVLWCSLSRPQTECDPQKLPQARLLMTLE